MAIVFLSCNVTKANKYWPLIVKNGVATYKVHSFGKMKQLSQNLRLCLFLVGESWQRRSHEVNVRVLAWM